MVGILYLVAGLILGFAIAFFYFKSKQINSNPSAVADTEKAVLQERVNNLLKESEKTVQNFTAEKNKLGEELDKMREELSQKNARIEASIEKFKAQEEKYTSLKAEIENLNKKYSTEFENIANKILDEKTNKFTEQNKTNLDIILNPLKERIKDFEAKVEKTYKAESDERIQLKTEIKSLVELNNKISQEANNLASALKGDNKKQGNWGEIILEKVLERSGLVKDIEYKTQVTTMNQEGDTIKPDVVVYLPDEKHVIVDSKVSLLAYNNFSNATTDEEREMFRKQHVESIRTHVKSLSEKNYQTSSTFSTPDFVLLFLPIESSFSAALQHDNELFNYAWEKKIVIVSPTTLLATLRTIASIWKQERQTRNAIEIARIGGSLYDGFVRFADEMKNIEKHINASHDAYQEAFKKLTHGKGNLVSTAEKIKSLGAKASKSIDSNILDGARESENLLNED